MGTRILMLIVVLNLALLTFSCTSSNYTLVVKRPKKQMCRGLVLHFVNNTKFLGLSKELVDALEVALIKAGYKVKEHSIASSFLTSQDRVVLYYHPEYFSSSRLVKRIGGINNVDWIIGGRIVKAVNSSTGVRVEFTLWVKDTQTGKLLWFGYYEATGKEYTSVLGVKRTSNVYELLNEVIKNKVLKDLRRVLTCRS